MGNPIRHSKSPLIHTLFAQQTGQHLEYRPILVEPGGFGAAADVFRDGGGLGLNVTVPFKQDAWVYVDELSARAERAKAVNTIWFRPDGSTLGENTDGLGLVRDLVINQGGVLEGMRILLMGSGGAARGVLQPLLASNPAVLVIANRTPAKARELAMLFGDQGSVFGCGFQELEGRVFDLIINATAAGLRDETPPLPPGMLADAGWCYDLMYADRPTAFVRWAREHGAVKALDGLGMLVEQAAESFHLWRGVRPETAPVLAALRGD
jgi:shikimate dehydrogenase